MCHGRVENAGGGCKEDAGVCAVPWFKGGGQCPPPLNQGTANGQRAAARGGVGGEHLPDLSVGAHPVAPPSSLLLLGVVAVPSCPHPGPQTWCPQHPQHPPCHPTDPPTPPPWAQHPPGALGEEPSCHGLPRPGQLHRAPRTSRSAGGDQKSRRVEDSAGRMGIEPGISRIGARKAPATRSAASKAKRRRGS